MAQYLYTGIVNKLRVRKIEELREYSFLPLDFYEKEDDDNYITLTLKESILTKENLIKFLEEEYNKFKVYNQEKILESLATGEGNIIEIVDKINEGNLQLINYSWYGVSVELISYLSDGKLYAETYYDTFNYYLDALRESSDNPLMKTVNYLVV